MATDDKPPNLPTAMPADEARQQAEAYDSMFACRPLELDDGSTIDVPPHPDFGMLDDDRMEEYEELLFEIDTTYDREPDIFIPEQRLKDADGNETGIVLPAETQRGALKRPFRIGNELVKPPHSVKVAQIALGEKDYELLRAGGRNAGDVWRVWGKQGLEVRQRQAADKKSDGGSVDLAAVPASDSK